MEKSRLQFCSLSLSTKKNRLLWMKKGFCCLEKMYYYNPFLIDYNWFIFTWTLTRNYYRFSFMELQCELAVFFLALDFFKKGYHWLFCNETLVRDCSRCVWFGRHFGPKTIKALKKHSNVQKLLETAPNSLECKKRQAQRDFHLLRPKRLYISKSLQNSKRFFQTMF